jgi:hypothetical protein
VHVFYDLDKGKEWFNNERRYGAAALEWLSTKFGHYPYPQATIVHSLLSGGMEYPMLIMNGNHSESLVLHEIGHMWFYGIFANDEHDEAWLDEGLTTFQNDWYLEHNYPDNGYAITRKMITPFENENLPRQMFVEREYKRVIRYVTSPQNEAVATHSPHFVHQYSYYINAYERTSMILHTLKRYLGEERFLAGMQLYFDRWALKHVNEDRFIKAMEDGANEELDWLFDQWLHTKNYMDYGLSEWKVEGNDSGTFRTEVKIHNLGGLFAPIPVTLMGSEGQTFTQILDDYMYRSRNNIIVETDFKPIRVILDKEDIFLDVDRRNNDSKYQFSLRYNFKGWNEYPLDRELYLWKPRIGFNDDNGVGVGIRLDRVYRLPGNFLALELDHNLRSGNPDFGISFQDQKVGLPLQAILRGNIGSWRQITHASMEFELAWAKTFWRKPVHYLTLMADYTDAHKLQRVTLNSESFSRLGINYKLQHKLWGMELGFSAKLQYAPEFLGEHAQDFNQSKLMLTWSKRLSTVRLINRTNVMNNSVNTPGIVSFRLATQDLRSLHMNRISQTLNFTNSIQSMGSHYQVVGGARMRAYTDSLNIAFKHAWSNNFDIVHHPKWVGFGNLGINTFFDIGKYSSDGINWLSVGDLGVGMSIRPTWKRTSWFTTIFRPFTLQFDLPIARIEDGNWEVTDVHKHWIFHVII